MEPQVYLAVEAIANEEIIRPSDLIIWDESSNILKETFESWLSLSFIYETLSNKTTYKIIAIIE